jgi:CRP-like cAMP-binding protein
MDTATALTIFRKAIAQYVVFNEEEWQVFTQHLTFSKLKKKQHFATADTVCDKVAFVVLGSVRYYHLINGDDITSYFSFEEDFASSYKSFLTRTPTITYIQALEETRLINISYNALQQMLANPLLAYKMERFCRLLAEHYLCCMEDRMTSFITQSPEERYLQLLRSQTGKDILHRMPQHYIANFLGITPVSLSRIRKRILEPVVK